MSVDEIVRLLDRLLANEQLTINDLRRLSQSTVASGLIDYMSRDALALLLKGVWEPREDATAPEKPITNIKKGTKNATRDR